MSRFNPAPRQQAHGGASIRDLWAVINKFFLGGYFNLTPSNIRGRASKFGTFTIASATTSVTVTHGCAFTPTADMIQITWTNSPTNDPGHWWVSAIDSDSFDVNVRADPGAGGATGAWSVDPL